jgi:hypothetical protein
MSQDGDQWLLLLLLLLVDRADWLAHFIIILDLVL